MVILAFFPPFTDFHLIWLDLSVFSCSSLTSFNVLSIVWRFLENFSLTFFSSLETQGQTVGARESLNGRENMAQKKSKEWPEEPLGTMSYQTCSKQSPPFWLLMVPENLCFSGTNQKPERKRPFGTGLVRHCPQGLLSPFFTFLRALFFRPFRLSLTPTICPWVSEDDFLLYQWLHLPSPN